MKRKQTSVRMMAVVLATGTLGASVLGAGCNVAGSEDGTREAEAVATGTVNLPLVTKVNDHLYRLSNTVIYLYGTHSTVALVTTDDPNETVLAQRLGVGSYDPYLVTWTLERQADDGVFRPVQARLISSPSRFEIFNGTTTSIGYRFESEGFPIELGTGNLEVVIDVSETLPACTPLGTDCGAGSWCPPPELTGRSPGCYPAGSVELGQPCDGPGVCVANASCFDLGTVPVCVALCDQRDFGVPCSGGGVCEPVAMSYGICR